MLVVVKRSEEDKHGRRVVEIEETVWTRSAWELERRRSGGDCFLIGWKENTNGNRTATVTSPLGGREDGQQALMEQVSSSKQHQRSLSEQIGYSAIHCSPTVPDTYRYNTHLR
ncbi:hypothetical protein Pcinc_032704 [Petrolisthes cinctipes]|uniref:Uncharacterized protein n=1 Tax=Petrolisthes cinctipes TaxID=88211 RepID=A0AAE1ETZ3_PETCI|nr:hypothetical protein Pcinc_032704 [Petrolisthes cinctipes]